MKKNTKTVGNPRKLGSDPTPGPTPPLRVRMAIADRTLVARAAALRQATESEYVRLIVLAQAKKDLGLS